MIKLKQQQHKGIKLICWWDPTKSLPDWMLFSRRIFQSKTLQAHIFSLQNVSPSHVVVDSLMPMCRFWDPPVGFHVLFSHRFLRTHVWFHQIYKGKHCFLIQTLSDFTSLSGYKSSIAALDTSHLKQLLHLSNVPKISENYQAHGEHLFVVHFVRWVFFFSCVENHLQFQSIV